MRLLALCVRANFLLAPVTYIRRVVRGFEPFVLLAPAGNCYDLSTHVAFKLHPRPPPIDGGNSPTILPIVPRSEGSFKG